MGGNGWFIGMALNTETLRITPEILSLIAAVDEFKGAWRAIGRIAPERLSSLRRVATIESSSLGMLRYSRPGAAEWRVLSSALGATTQKAR